MCYTAKIAKWKFMLEVIQCWLQNSVVLLVKLYDKSEVQFVWSYMHGQDDKTGVYILFILSWGQ